MATGSSVDSAAYPWDELTRAAIEARAQAYAPYSGFHVGASILTDTQEIIGGANVENASLGLTICAERVAMSSAIMAGHRKWQALVVVTPGASAPCGACRQFLAEFAAEAYVALVDPQTPDARRILPFSELLPLQFTGKHLHHAGRRSS